MNELAKILAKYDYSLLIFDEELEEMINEKDIDSLLPRNSPKELREEIENLLNNSLSERIAFGFRSFRRFKARIMICKNLLHMKKANA